MAGYFPLIGAAVELREEGDGDHYLVGEMPFYDGTPRTEFVYGRYRERIDPGAYTRTLAENRDIRSLFNHDSNWVLGRQSAGTLSLNVVDTGLRYRVKLPNSPTGDNVAESVRRQDVSGTSIMFDAVNEKYDRDKEADTITRTLLDVELYEIGPVTWPAYDSSSVSISIRSALEHELLGACKAWESRQKQRQDAVKAWADRVVRAINAKRLAR